MNTIEHPLDLCATDTVLDLFAEEVSPTEQMQLCCDGCAGTAATLSCTTGCVASFSTMSSYSCECS